MHVLMNWNQFHGKSWLRFSKNMPVGEFRSISQKKVLQVGKCANLSDFNCFHGKLLSALALKLKSLLLNQKFRNLSIVSSSKNN